MNAHPLIGTLAAGPLEAVVLPPPVAGDALNLPVAPSRVAPSNDNAPTVDGPSAKASAGPVRSRWRQPAIVVSVLVHAIAAWAIGDRLARGPVEADDPDAIAVELVVAPAAPQLPPASASAGGASAQAGLDAGAESPPLALPPVRDFDPSLALAPPPVPPPPEPRVVAPEPPQQTLAVLATPPQFHAGPAVAPLPEPRPAAKAAPSAEPDRPRRKTEARQEAPRPRNDAVTRKSAAPVEARPASSAAKPGKPAKAASAGAGGKSSAGSARPAGASAAAKAAYGSKLLSHVQRFKRYPAAAAGATGVTRLAVTIGRDGALRGVRVSSGSGNKALDAEARSTAQRAAPYPRPPDGVGGASITFSVALRFSR